MIVGTEWLVEAEECNENFLRDEAILRAVFSRIINDLGLKTINEPLWHKFGGEGGVTGLGNAHRIAPRLSHLSRTQHRNL